MYRYASGLCGSPFVISFQTGVEIAPGKSIPLTT
jgi:hypothetical protein